MQNRPSHLSKTARWLLVLGLFLIANSAYLAAFGDPSLLYVANALLHPFVGIVAAILLVIFIKRHRELIAGAAAGVTALLLALATIVGIYLLFVGMSRPHSMALYAHVSASIAGLFLLLVILHARARGAGTRGGDRDGMAMELARRDLCRSVLRCRDDLPARLPQ